MATAGLRSPKGRGENTYASRTWKGEIAHIDFGCWAPPWEGAFFIATKRPMNDSGVYFFYLSIWMSLERLQVALTERSFEKSKDI